jgi:hypothetical protein
MEDAGMNSILCVCNQIRRWLNGGDLLESRFYPS